MFYALWYFVVTFGVVILTGWWNSNSWWSSSDPKIYL